MKIIQIELVQDSRLSTNMYALTNGGDIWARVYIERSDKKGIEPRWRKIDLPGPIQNLKDEMKKQEQILQEQYNANARTQKSNPAEIPSA